MISTYLKSVLQQLKYYKSLGEKAMEQVSEENLFWEYDNESNSIAVIIRHLSGNMLSRWTDFLHTDGEKEWRNRDVEFNNAVVSREAIMAVWEQGWSCVFHAIGSLQEEDLNKTIYIRNEPHSVVQAINRQLAHYPYHVGQIVYIAKMRVAGSWRSLSIPKGMSDTYNQNKFAEGKRAI